MSKPKTVTKPSPKRPVDVGRLIIRGLTDADHEALAAAVERARARAAIHAPGANVSQNSVALALLRAGLASDAAKRSP